MFHCNSETIVYKCCFIKSIPLLLNLLNLPHFCLIFSYMFQSLLGCRTVGLSGFVKGVSLFVNTGSIDKISSISPAPISTYRLKAELLLMSSY